MNLIRNTLIFVVLIQLLGFLYFKTFHKQRTAPPIQRLTKNIPLPQSTEYTTYTEDIPQIIKESLPKKVTPVKIALATVVPKKPILETKKSPIKTALVRKKIVIKKTTIKKSKKISPKKIYSKHYVKNTKPPTLNKKVESYAKKLLGYKYVWGATGPKTFDCSGFTQKVYRKTAGIRLPRVSRDQAKVGKYIKYAKLKKGDMVFFDTEKKYTKRVNHVGIYIGNNKFIHASSARKKIIITSFKRKPFYKKRFLWGRRVLKDNQNVNVAMLLKKSSEI